jgi:nucleoside-diphosphate-sugar epimerase
MKVLVTGGAGLIGMAARKTLASRGHEVTRSRRSTSPTSAVTIPN